ncbi:MAG: ribosome recycling factor [Fibrobacteres bacterium]|nr:ribosome recycling factor [Fibrobacterota bacterium]
MSASAEERMKKACENLVREFAKVRTGQANPAMLDSVMVDYYGTPTAIGQVATISVPDARTLGVSPWEKHMIPVVDKAIRASGLGLNPSTEGSMIRVILPPLTEERRKELAKVCKGLAEEARVAVRNIRRDENDSIKKQVKDESLSQDQEKKLLEAMQKLTDRYIAEVDKSFAVKEKEILTV